MAPRKCVSLNSSDVPMQVIPLSNLSPLERKDLRERLRSELEQVRSLQKEIELPRACGGDGKNKKSKKPLRQKPRGRNLRSSGEFEPEATAAAEAARALLKKDCEPLLKRLMNHKYAWVFNTPVDVVKLDLPDYFSIIKHPMDLGTIKSKIAAGEYEGPSQFAADVRLTFSNAMAYNPPGDDAHTMADTLSEYFELRWRTIEKKLPKTNNAPPPDNHEDVEINKPVLRSRKRKLESLIPQDEAVPPAKRVMSEKEKDELAIELESLMAEMPNHIVDFLKENSSNDGGCGDDEIVVEIDILSDDTLFKLRKLLDDYLQEKQEKNTKVKACEVELLNVSGPTDPSLQAFKDNDPDDEEVDIGGNEPLVSSYPPMEIERDTTHGMNQSSSPESSSDKDSSSSSDSDSDDY